jgi:hypothetical protein
VVGASPHHAGSPPSELLFVFTVLSIGLSRYFPAPVDGRIPEAHWFVGGRSASKRRLVGAVEHGSLCGGVVGPSGFEHDAFQSGESERVGHLASAGSGPNDGDIVFSFGFGNRDGGHIYRPLKERFSQMK